MKKIILFLIIIASITEGCKKYEEGPCISLRSAKNRLTGTFTITQYLVNGVDSLNQFKDSLYNVIELLYDENSPSYGATISGKRNDGKLSGLDWVWILKDKNTILQVTFSHCFSGIGIFSWPSGTGPFRDKVLPEWKILCLKYNNINLKTIFNDKEYLIKLTRL